MYKVKKKSFGVLSLAALMAIPAFAEGPTRAESLPTAQDQARGSKNDVEITRLIRKDINDKIDLSTEAKNVKIITMNGNVTLRGPVQTTAEKSMVESIAHNHVPSSAKVTNELKVKP